MIERWQRFTGRQTINIKSLFAKEATAGFIIVSSTPTQLIIEKLGDKQVPAFSRSTGNILPDTQTGRMTFTAIQSGRDTLLTLHAQTIHFPGTAMQEIEEANDPALAEVAQAVHSTPKF